MTLRALIQKRGPVKKIGVVGMGYVGIPAAALFADSAAVDFVYRVPAQFAIFRL